ncbi:NlpC/P60 family peptidoglycan-binding protein RipD [uncultured Mycolicibacterium sp.]|uniref:NlpC/P60 family peptidoglycan-binding protein RipD n=1 Tax=uncultured Mycolicibacterium sp. TaxID=2320817 RepID=UPI00263588F0|nr:NlpC/P60 family peptidoglycan-binding protein RipD [uncultured Mycolicibacterium sp.]
MKRLLAVVLGLAVVLVTPGLASAYPYPRPTANQKAVEVVIARALAARGVPFVYGGGDVNGPTRPADRPDAPADLPLRDPRSLTAGFDASGLIVYAFAGAGIKMPRTSGDQYKVSQKIPPSLALPGDLIFYGPEGTQSVALFIGNGQMVEATDPVVTVSPVRFANMTPYVGRIIQ